MWSKIFVFTTVLTAIISEKIAPDLDRTMSEGVKSLGYKIVYGDEDLTIINDVVDDMEKNVLNKKVNVNDLLPPLPAQDVKCLMSVDRYCSKDMGQIKGIIIEALKNDCQKCSIKQKEDAGKVIASMMAHDPVAWKLFLTRSALQIKPAKESTDRSVEPSKFKLVGEPEELIRSKSRYTYPGVKVRVKRYVTDKI